MTRLSRALGASLFFVASAVASRDAAAQPTSARACAEAASAGQVLRDEGKLVDARAKFVTCAQPSCPKLIQKDCAQWQSEVDERLPTIVIAAKDDAGKDVRNVTVTIDGKPLTNAVDGRSIPIDPGAHKFHFESPGLEPDDTEAVVREGERARGIEGRLKRPGWQQRQQEQQQQQQQKVIDYPREPETKGGPGAWPWVLGGVALVGAGLGTYFTLSMFSDVNSCKPHCSDDQINTIKTKNTLEIVSFAVGGAALVGAIVVVVASSGSSSAQVKAMATPGGGRATFELKF